jgi:hypothetical protein
MDHFHLTVIDFLMNHLLFCADTALDCNLPDDRSDVDVNGSKVSDNGSSGFGSVDSSSFDAVLEAIPKDSDDEIPGATETESDSLHNSDNEQLIFQTLDEEETAVRANPLQPVQSDDCNFSKIDGKIYAEKCVTLESANINRSNPEKQEDHTAINVQLIDIDASEYEKDKVTLPKCKSIDVICPRYKTDEATALSLWERKVKPAAPECGCKEEFAFDVDSQNIVTASQRCEQNTANGSCKFCRHGTTAHCKHNPTGAADVHEDQEVAAVQGMGRGGDVLRGYEQPQMKEILTECGEEKEESKDKKHNKEEMGKDTVEFPESKEEEKREITENKEADKEGKNEENAVEETLKYEEKRNKDKQQRNNYSSVFRSVSSSGEKRSERNYVRQSKKVEDRQQNSPFGHPSQNGEHQPEPGEVRCSYQFAYTCCPFWYLLVYGI